MGILLEGDGTFIWDGDHSLPIHKGTEFFLPHGLQAYQYHANQNLKILECYPPL